MFRFFRWLFISLALAVLAIAMAFGLKQVQNKYCPPYQNDVFADNNYTGNAGSLKEAIQGAITLLEKQKYRVFFASYIPEKGKKKFLNNGALVRKLVDSFKREKADKMLDTLRVCAQQDYEMSDKNLKAVCTLKKKIAGKSSMTFIKEKGTWRIED